MLAFTPLSRPTIAGCGVAKASGPLARSKRRGTSEFELLADNSCTDRAVMDDAKRLGTG